MRKQTRKWWFAVLAALLVVTHELHAAPLPQALRSDTVAAPSVLTVAEYAITEGDILGYAPLERPDLLQRGMARAIAGDKWPFGLVYYQFDASLSAADIEILNNAIEHWNSRSSITIVERADNSIIDYINFAANEGCASWVGKIGGVQDIWVGPTCNTGSMIHEIGHAIGLFHEHTREDRDNYIIVEWDNIKEGKELNFNIITDGIALIGEYDYGSIMHYGTGYFSAAGQPTITVPDGVSIGQRKALSAGDISTIAAMYQTDLALLLTKTANEENLSTIEITVNNIGSMGAHAIVFTQPIETGGEESILDNGLDWQCDIQDQHVVCKLDKLAAGDTTTFSLAMINATTGFDEQLAWLEAKTHDPDLTNNGNLPPISAATPDGPGELSTDDVSANTEPGKESSGDVAEEVGISSPEQAPEETSIESDTDATGSPAQAENTGGSNGSNNANTNAQEPELSQAQSLAEDIAAGGLAFWWIGLLPLIRRRQLDS